MIDNIRKNIFDNKKVFLWGSGKICKDYLRRYGYLYELADGILDNNVSMHGKKLGDISIYGIDHIQDCESVFIIILSGYCAEISEQLEALNFVEGKNYIKYFELEKYIDEKVRGLNADEIRKIKYEMYGQFMDTDLNAIELKIRDEKFSEISFFLWNVLLKGAFANFYTIYYITAVRGGYGNDFIIARVQAESCVRREEKQDDSMFYRIYDKLALFMNIGDDEKNRLMNIELNVFWQYVSIRKSGKRLYMAARSANKEIWIYTDLCYPYSFLKKIMEEKGGIDLENIVRIRSYGEEELALLINSTTKNVQRHMHIGTRYFSNNLLANINGITTVWFPPAIFRVQNNAISKYMQYCNEESGNIVLASYLIEEIFDDPFIKYDDEAIFNGDIDIFTKMIIAPIIFEFVLWMHHDLEKNECNKLVLVYRDGYMIEKISHLLEEYVKSNVSYSEAYLSRTVRYCVYAKEDNGFWRAQKELPLSNTMRVSDFVRNRLLLRDTEEADAIKRIYISTGKNADDMIAPLSLLFKEIMFYKKCYKENATQRLNVLEKYCKSIIDVPQKTAVFDIGYRASVVRMLHEQFGLDTKGYHLFGKSFQNINDYAGENTKCFIQYSKKMIDETMILHPLMEDIISVQEGTAERIYEENGEFVIKKNENYRYNEKIAHIQNGIIDYIKEIIALMREDCWNVQFDNNLEFEVLTDFLKRPKEKDAKFLRDMKFQDSDLVAGQGNQSIYENWYIKKTQGEN